MAESQMKNRIAEELKKAKGTGKDAAKATAEAAGRAAHAMAEEAGELGKKAADAAKQGISGLWKGAKDALEKKTEK